MTTYYKITDDGATFKCYECGVCDRASKKPFVKITGLFGARHAACVEDLADMQEIPEPSGGFDPR